jgi:hypothetical protein
MDEAGEVSRDWMKLEQAVSQTKNYNRKKRKISHAANI